MNMEQLTKSQIILLTLLVSFVTSIATGIVTVTLLEQAPEPVTQTINRIVERTIERVVPDTSKQQASIVTKEIQTVVVQEEDVLAGSIDSVGKSLVRIYTVALVNTASSTTPASSNTAKGESTEKVEVFRGMGVFVTEEGLVATADSILVPGRVYRVKTSGGEIFGASIRAEGNANVGLLDVVLPNEDTKKTFTPVGFTNLSKLKLGQSVFTLEGEKSTVVTTGIVSALNMKEVFSAGTKKDSVEGSSTVSEETEAVSKTDTILATISATTKVTMSGAPLANLFGEIIGMRVSEEGNFVPLDASMIAQLQSASAEVTAEAR